MRLDEQVEWDKISTERDRPALPPNEYICLVKSVEDDVAATGTPKTTIVAVVTEGEHVDREIWDQIYPKTKKGGVNKIAMGQIKEWAAATVGMDRLSAKDFDTKEFEGHTVRIITELGSYEVDDVTPGAAPGAKKSKAKSQIKKVMKA